MIVDLNKCRRKLQDDYDRLVRWRWSLEQARTIDHRNLTEIDALLTEHPLLDDAMNLKIKSRAIRVLWMEYSGCFDDWGRFIQAGPQRKREILLSLREQFLALPQHYRDELWQEWFRWLDEFEEEEIAEGTRTEREYVWSPEVREMLP
jgi:hypothetical protein